MWHWSFCQCHRRSLSLALRAVDALNESPVFEPALAEFQKLSKGLTERLGIDYATIASCVTFKTTGIDQFVEPEILEKLITAIRERQEFEIVYSKLNASVEAFS